MSSGETGEADEGEPEVVTDEEFAVRIKELTNSWVSLVLSTKETQEVVRKQQRACGMAVYETNTLQKTKITHKVTT